MAAIVDIAIERPVWETLGLDEIARRAAEATLSHLGIDETCEISLLATGDTRIAELNADFRAKEAATNVLSWPAADLGAGPPGLRPSAPVADFPGEVPFLGDIALAWETCAAEADAAGKPMNAHVSHLFVHGLLHLLGYDHVDDEDADLMERLEVEILGKLGLPDPY